jgi:hypothetical protein
MENKLRDVFAKSSFSKHVFAPQSEEGNLVHNIKGFSAIVFKGEKLT